jgi:hypothetical protein
MSGRHLQRCSSQQFMSLLDWASAHLPSKSLIIGQQLRWAGTSATQKSIKYSKERKSYEANLAELRKAWAKQQEELAVRRAAQAEAKEAQRVAAKSQRAQDDAADKETRRLELLARQEAARELRVSTFLSCRAYHRLLIFLLYLPVVFISITKIVFSKTFSSILQAQEKHQRLQRQELRMDILDAARAARQQTLLKESRQWIDAESLDARVQEALDNVVPLWTENAKEKQG